MRWANDRIGGAVGVGGLDERKSSQIVVQRGFEWLPAPQLFDKMPDRIVEGRLVDELPIKLLNRGFAAAVEQRQFLAIEQDAAGAANDLHRIGRNR